MRERLGCTNNRAFGLCVATESFVSRHGFPAGWAVWVATEAFFILKLGVVSRQGLPKAVHSFTTRHDISQECRAHDSACVWRPHSWRARQGPVHAIGRLCAHTRSRAAQQMSPVVIDNSLSRQRIPEHGIFPCHDIGLMSQQCMAKARGDIACDRTHSVHAAACTTLTLLRA